MRLVRWIARCAAGSLVAVAATTSAGSMWDAAPSVEDNSGAPVIHGTRGTVLHLEFAPDQTYTVKVGLGSLLQIDFPSGEHVQHVVVSAMAAARAQHVGDTVQVSPVRADAVTGINILTTRGTYRMQIASTQDSTQSTGFVHFGLPGVER